MSKLNWNVIIGGLIGMLIMCGWRLFREDVGNIQTTCPRCDKVYTITTCWNCGAEGKFKMTIGDKQFECIECSVDGSVYECMYDGTIIRRFKIE